MRLKLIILCTLLSMGIAHATTTADANVTTPDTVSNHVIIGWDGPITHAVIDASLDRIQRIGFRNFIVEPGSKMGFPYLSDAWFAHIRYAAEQAQRRGMKMWIIDEGKYPSGMAGGRFSRERKDLCMWALVPKGDTVMTIRRSSQTCCVDNPTGKRKDETNSLCDYLDSAAVGQFIEWTHARYAETLGPLLGTTVLGLRGDEPAFVRTPWTPRMPEYFLQENGYSLEPWMKVLVGGERYSLADSRLSLTERRVRADYWKTFSRHFADTFFGMPAAWTQRHGVQSIVHLDKDDDLPWCTRFSGDPFLTLSRVQVPGIDVIWTQIMPGCNTEFPRLASSVAHVWGQKLAFSESFAAWRARLTMPIVRYVLNYQMVHGINLFEFMWLTANNEPTGYLADPGMKDVVAYTDRATARLQQGRPDARVAVYVPMADIWNGDNRSYAMMKGVGHMLASRQHDYDLLTDDGIDEACTVGNGYLQTRGGARYEAVVIPDARLVRQSAWAKLRDFASRGGRVLYVGSRPDSAYAQSFTHMTAAERIDGTVVSDSTWSDAWQQALPTAAVTLVGAADDSILVNTRRTNDGRLYTLFNARQAGRTITVDLDAIGTVTVWDAETDRSRILKSKVVGNKTRVTIDIDGWTCAFLIVKKRTVDYDARRYRSLQACIDRIHSDGGGTMVLRKGTFRTGALVFPRGVDLRIERGAVLESIVDTARYPIVTTRWEGIMQPARAALLTFDHADDCVVSGDGLIDARGLEWKELLRGTYGKPKTLCFDHCDGGTIRDVHIRNQAFWCLHVLFTNSFTIDGVSIDAQDYIPSSDGIDIDSSTGVTIQNAHIKAHDDCISIKSGKDTDGRRVGRPSEDIVIRNCHFDYGHGGVAIGSEVSGGIRRVLVTDCDFMGENWNPIRIKSQPSRGGVVEDITFQNLDIRQARNIFEINLMWRMKGMTEPPYEPRTQLRNIVFRNIRGKAQNAGLFQGYAEAPLTPDLFHFEDCVFTCDKPLTLRNATLDLSGARFITPGTTTK